uniref:RNase H type-1 domain-containing protein n=1 Tax=Cannabis sativa TaxID=3483 RepID=A0A803NJD2_CANSA
MVQSVQVWIRLNGLGLQWGKNNLSALVSTIGKPIMVEKFTLNRSMVKFARVLVDIANSDNPSKIISFINERKQLVEQTIEKKKKNTAGSKDKSTVNPSNELDHSSSNGVAGAAKAENEKQGLDQSKFVQVDIILEDAELVHYAHEVKHSGVVWNKLIIPKHRFILWAIILDTALSNSKGFKPFRFLEAWTRDNSCKEVIAHAWISSGVNSAKTLLRNLDNTKRALQKWSRDVFGDCDTQIKILEGKIMQIQSQETFNDLIALESQLNGELMECWKHKEKDEGTKSGLFAMLKGEDRKTSKSWEISLISIFNTCLEVLTLPLPPEMENLYVSKVGTEDNSLIKTIPSDDEITKTVWQMHPLKAPEPDGFSGCFHRSYWNIVEDKVINTQIGSAPSWITSFLLSNSAFIPGRWIAESSILTQEIVHTINRLKGLSGLMAVKLDMHKAYDRMEWVFLQKVLMLACPNPRSWSNCLLHKYCSKTSFWEVKVKNSDSYGWKNILEARKEIGAEIVKIFRLPPEENDYLIWKNNVVDTFPVKEVYLSDQGSRFDAQCDIWRWIWKPDIHPRISLAVVWCNNSTNSWSSKAIHCPATSSLEGEVRAILMVLSWAKENDLHNITIASDSLTLVKAFSNRRRILDSQLWNVSFEILKLLNDFGICNLIFVKR